MKCKLAHDFLARAVVGLTLNQARKFFLDRGHSLSLQVTAILPQPPIMGECHITHNEYARLSSGRFAEVRGDQLPGVPTPAGVICKKPEEPYGYWRAGLCACGPSLPKRALQAPALCEQEQLTGAGAFGLEVVRDLAELLQRCFQIIDDFAGDDVRGGEVGAVFKRFVFEPEDIQ